MHKHNFNLSDSNIMIFEFVYKIVIVMLDINDVLRKLNVLNLKKNKNSIDKLINLIKIVQKTNKSFNLKTAFASSVLLTISTQITFEKIIESFIKTFKIMHFNNAQTIIVDKVQKLVNIILCRQSVALSVNASIDFEQISIQIAQVNIFNSKNCYNCIKSEHKINDCSKINQLMNSDLIHFNEQKKICFDRTEQEKTKMRLQYKLFCVKIVRQCLQQVNDSQSVTMKVNSIIIVKKLFFSEDEHNKKKFHDKKILMKIRAARHENDFSARKIL